MRSDVGGGLLFCCLEYEARHLADLEYVEGVANRRGFRYLRLLVDPRKAYRALRRAGLSRSRLTAEDCTTVQRINIPGGGVLFSHIRAGAWSPEARGVWA